MSNKMIIKVSDGTFKEFTEREAIDALNKSLVIPVAKGARQRVGNNTADSYCPVCLNFMMDDENYCPMCGQRVR